MDFSKLPKIRDEDRENVFGYVYGVSGPGKYYFAWFKKYAIINLPVFKMPLDFLFILRYIICKKKERQGKKQGDGC